MEELSANLFEHEDAVGRLWCGLYSDGAHASELARKHLDATLPPPTEITLTQAEHVYAREQGLADWNELRARVYRAGLDGADPTTPFQRAELALHTADGDGLREQLTAHSELVVSEPNGSEPLLSQAVGLRSESAVAILLDAGADVQRTAPCGCTPIHRAGYGHPPGPRPSAQTAHRRIVDLLVDAGARLDGSSHGDGGTPLAMALFWGHAELAEHIADRGGLPVNLRTAAGLGRLDLIEHYFDGARLRSGAGAKRGFYRPHEDFPAWKPTGTGEELLDEAFYWAARNGRVDAMQALVDRGARIDATIYLGTPLQAVAYAGPIDAVRWLLDRGADPARRGEFPRGATALHSAAAGGRLDTVAALLDHGADPNIEDDEFESTPLGYAKWFGNVDAARLLEERGC